MYTLHHVKLIYQKKQVQQEMDWMDRLTEGRTDKRARGRTELQKFNTPFFERPEIKAKR